METEITSSDIIISFGKSLGRVTLEIILDSQDIVIYEFILQSQTVNKEMYVGIYSCLWDAIKRVCPEKETKKRLGSFA